MLRPFRGSTPAGKLTHILNKNPPSDCSLVILRLFLARLSFTSNCLTDFSERFPFCPLSPFWSLVVEEIHFLFCSRLVSNFVWNMVSGFSFRNMERALGLDGLFDCLESFSSLRSSFFYPFVFLPGTCRVYWSTQGECSATNTKISSLLTLVTLVYQSSRGLFQPLLIVHAL